MDYTRFFAKRVGRRRQNFIRKLTSMRATRPEAISLDAGSPNPANFPVKTMSVTYTDDIFVKLIGRDLNTALQYGPSQGHLPLVKKYRDFQQKWHSPPRSDWDVLFTAGSQDGFCKVLDLVMEEGESVMVQVPTYSATLGAAEVPPTGGLSGWAEGQMNPETFPIEKMSVRLKDGTVCQFRNDELRMALETTRAQGIPVLLNKFRAMQKLWHDPPNNEWDVLVVNGSQDGLWRVFNAFIDAGDPVMVQTPVYFGVVGAIDSLAPDFIGIQQDANGIIPEEIEKACEERIRKNKALPKMLYVNPIAANPTGSSLMTDRKQRVYELAQKYDFLIVEDDPYFFLHFLDEQPKSFLSMDTEGRVIRLDSFSKIISAGLRLGVVTANKEIIKKLTVHVENSILHSSSLSQMIIYKLFETWDHERFEQHFKEIQSFYKQKRDLMLEALDKHLTGLAEWSVPNGGMFVWIKIIGIENALDITVERFLPNNVFVIPGNAFNYDGTIPDQHLRLCYSFATSEEVNKGLSIIAKIIREEVAKTRDIRVN